MSKKIVVAGIAVVAVAAAGWSSLKWFGKNEGNGVRVSGNIELTQVDIAFKIPGKLVERAVGEGDPVQKGMVVARLDRSSCWRSASAARAALAGSESLLVQQRTAIDFQGETMEGQIQQRQAELRAGRGEAGRTAGRIAHPGKGAGAGGGGPGAVGVRPRGQGLEARADAVRQRRHLDGDNRPVPHAVRTRGAQLKQAKEQLALVVEGPRKETIEAARAQWGRRRRRCGWRRRSGWS